MLVLSIPKGNNNCEIVFLLPLTFCHILLYNTFACWLGVWQQAIVQQSHQYVSAFKLHIADGSKLVAIMQMKLCCIVKLMIKISRVHSDVIG